MDEITPRQQKVLVFLARSIRQHGFPTTLRYIAAHLGVASTFGIMRHLAALEKKGLIRRQSGGSGGITLLPRTGGTGYPEEPERMGIFDEERAALFLPVVGVVRAGVRQPPAEDIEEYRSVDRSLVRAGTAYFLRVKGDSMINAGVLEGDLAIIRPQPTAENRDMVVALVDGEATLKWFFHERTCIRLQPANPNMDAIIVTPDRDVTISGKVVGLFRTMV
jgi:repressor LexA